MYTYWIYFFFLLSASFLTADAPTPAVPLDLTLSVTYLVVVLTDSPFKGTKIDKVYCLGLHHFTNENTICLCRKSIKVLISIFLFL